MVLVIDNYDSFTYNLVQYSASWARTSACAATTQVTLDEIAAMAPEQIVISPGPGRPEDAGVSVDVIRRFGPTTPILGVCLGHQAIGVVYGGDRLSRAARRCTARRRRSSHDGKGVFAGIAAPFQAGRYHSLVIASDSVPAELEVAARTQEDGTIMAVRHRTYPVHGVQFHPESVLTDEGRRILRNFLDLLMFTAAAREARAPRGPHRPTRPPRRCARSWKAVPRRRARRRCWSALVDEGRAAVGDRRLRADDARACGAS